MKQYQTFLFDLDGTLLDSNAHVIECFQVAFTEVLGEPLPEATITSTFGIPLGEAITTIAPDHADALLKAYRAHSDKLGDSRLRMIDGAYDLLKALKERGATVAIVTSKKEVNALHQMQLFQLDEYCDLLVGPEKTTAHKPDPAPIHYAIDALQTTADQCLMIGDSPHDILCGQNAHVDTAGVLFTAVGKDVLRQAQPTYEIEQLADLIPYASYLE